MVGSSRPETLKRGRMRSRLRRCSTSSLENGNDAVAHLVHGGLIFVAPGIREGEPVERVALRLEDRLALARDRGAPVDHGAEHIEEQGFDGCGIEHEAFPRWFSVAAFLYHSRRPHPPRVSHGHRRSAVRRRHHAGGAARWVECESPTYDPARVNAMVALASRECGRRARLSSRSPAAWGWAIARATISLGHADKPGILIMGHMDTVHPVGTLENLPFRREGGRCYGPGILDMKGGNFLALQAMRSCSGRSAPALPVTCCSPATRKSAARHARHDRRRGESPQIHPGAGTRPCRGGVTTGRYAIARFNLTATGRPAMRARAQGRALGDPRNGEADRDRGDDDGGLHLQRRRRAWRAMGELRLDRCARRPSAWQAAGGSRCRRPADARADQGDESGGST